MVSEDAASDAREPAASTDQVSTRRAGGAANQANTVTLTNGVTMPLVGFGTWQMRGREAENALLWAFEAGYRRLDTATMYGNEAELGAAIRRSGLPREELFVGTKLPPGRAGQEKQTLQHSLDALGVDHVDLWLVHWPPNGAGVDVWRTLIDLQEQGLVRTIGVSNYSAAQVDELAAETGVAPAVNQVKTGPPLLDRSLREQSQEPGVVLEGYSPLKGGRLNHRVVTEIADRHGKTPAQVLVRWHLEHGYAVIPKSAHQDRVAANIDVFDFRLDAEDVEAIDGLLAGR